MDRHGRPWRRIEPGEHVVESVNEATVVVHADEEARKVDEMPEVQPALTEN
jgi:hypothetical protein